MKLSGKIAAVCSGIAALFGATMVGQTMAATSTPVGGLNIVQITETYTGLSAGASNYRAPCPSGYKPIGGGGFAHLPGTNDTLNLLSSAPYDDGSYGWGVGYNVPSNGSSWVIFVYASCIDFS